MILAAHELGFSSEAELRDRSQMQFVAMLMRQGATRFILKGGMAMRALYGSTRLTRDVDFDCEDNVSQQSMQGHMSKALTQSARLAGMTGTAVDQTKKADRSNRWRITGSTAEGIAVAWDVEVSRRGVPPAEFIETRLFETPLAYRIPAFNVRVYGPAAMAGGKVNALLSPNRSVPRDVYDLFELARHGASPVPLWTQSIPKEILQSKLVALMAKIDGIDFPLANSELLPYVAADIRMGIDAARWDEIRLEVAEHVERWITQAIEHAKPATETEHGDDEIDLAWR